MSLQIQQQYNIYDNVCYKTNDVYYLWLLISITMLKGSFLFNSRLSQFFVILGQKLSKLWSFPKFANFFFFKVKICQFLDNK